MNNEGIQERTEVILHVANDLSVLAKLFASLSEELPQIDAWRFYTRRERAAILIITKTGSRVPVILRAAGFECETNLVLVLEEMYRRISALRLSAELRASGIHILDAYTCDSAGNGSLLVLKTVDCEQAATALSTMNLQPTNSINVAHSGDIADGELEVVHAGAPQNASIQ